MSINFSTIKNLFPKDQWDVGYLTATQLLKCANKPIKWKFYNCGADFTNDIHFYGLKNCVVLIKSSEIPGDYRHYEDAISIMDKSSLGKWIMIYTNYKEAALQAGLGVRAKNSLIYTYRFGFDAKICVLGFNREITNTPTNTRVNKKLSNRCIGCWDCAINCPVKAIHNDGDKMEENWIDSGKCDDFLGLSDHPTIPSIKHFWHKHVHPELSKKEVNKLKTWNIAKKKYGEYGLPWDQNGYTFDGSHGLQKDNKTIPLNYCRECTSQPRCSKWKGHYPYPKTKVSSKM